MLRLYLNGSTSVDWEIVEILSLRELQQLVILKTYSDELLNSLEEELQSENNSMLFPIPFLCKKTLFNKLSYYIMKT